MVIGIIKELIFGHWLDKKTTAEIERFGENGVLTLSDLRYIARTERYVKRARAGA